MAAFLGSASLLPRLAALINNEDSVIVVTLMPSIERIWHGWYPLHHGDFLSQRMRRTPLYKHGGAAWRYSIYSSRMSHGSWDSRPTRSPTHSPPARSPNRH